MPRVFFFLAGFFFEKSSHVAMRSDLRLHTSWSEVNKNINLGYSQDYIGTRVTPIVSGLGFMGNLPLPDFKSGCIIFMNPILPLNGWIHTLTAVGRVLINTMSQISLG